MAYRTAGSISWRSIPHQTSSLIFTRLIPAVLRAQFFEDRVGIPCAKWIWKSASNPKFLRWAPACTARSLKLPLSLNLEELLVPLNCLLVGYVHGFPSNRKSRSAILQQSIGRYSLTSRIALSRFYRVLQNSFLMVTPLVYLHYDLQSERRRQLKPISSMARFRKYHRRRPSFAWQRTLTF